MNLLVPVSWLRDYLKTDLAAKTIASYLTASGPSVERIEKSKGDYIFDIEVTSNRPDAYCIFGIAREANAILVTNGEKSTLAEPMGLDLNLDPDTQDTVSIDAQVTDSKLCPRFTAIALEVKIGPSPALIKNRLSKCGIRPINNIVDITNYIMLETGQPMHAFDFDKIEGSKMILRPSREGEKLTTLDGIKRQLPKGTIVIQDAKKLIDLAGIMGGENSQITKRTKRVVFFVQAYSPDVIRRTTQTLALRSEAATRFEKGVDVENILPVTSRAVYLAKKIARAKIASELVDIYPTKQETKTIRLTFAKLNKYLGLDLNPAKVVQMLIALGFKATLEIASLKATPPPWRSQDTQDDVDLIEEIARLYGYHNLPSALPSGSLPTRTDSDLKKVIDLKRSLRNFGLTEVVTYSIISKDMLNLSNTLEKNAVELINPLTEEWQFMRPTVIPSLLEVISKNYNLRSDIAIFEVAKTYIKQKSILPIQDLYLTIALNNSNFYNIKGLIENVFEILRRKVSYTKTASGILNEVRNLGKKKSKILRSPQNDNNLFDPNQLATIKIGDQIVGTLGILKTALANHFAIENPVAAVELNLTTIYDLPTQHSQYLPIPKFPPIIEDISAIFSVYTPLADITTEIKKASTLIKKTEVIDIFEDPKLGDLKKSVTLRLTYQKATGTPTQSEVNTERAKITRALESNLRAKVRR